MKYVIKNCPCYDKDYSCQSKDNITGKYCKGITDCVIKQIIGKLKPLQMITFEHGIKGMFNAEVKVELKQVSEILKLLEIEGTDEN